MKKLLLILIFGFGMIFSYAQVSNAPVFRIDDAVTAFGKNIPTGTYVFDIANEELFVATAGIASTATITTASASLKLINNGTGTDDQTIDDFSITGSTISLEIEDDGVGAQTIDIQESVEDISGGMFSGNTETLITATYQDGDGTVDLIVNDDLSLYDNTTSGFLTSEVDGSTTNELQDLSYDAANHEIDISDGGTSAVIPLAIADGATEGLASFDSGDFDATAGNVNIANQGVDYAEIQNVAANNVFLGNDNGASSTVQELSAADARTILNVADGAEVNLVSITESFEETSGVPSAHALSQTAVTSQDVIVSQNGRVLKESEYTLASGSITLTTKTYQYDEVTITYWYQP